MILVLRPILKTQTKQKMKKFLAIVAIAAFMTSCNDEKKTETTVTTDTSAVKMDTKMPDTAVKMDTKMADTSKMMDKMADTTKMK